jgi:hypothetical protein
VTKLGTRLLNRAFGAALRPHAPVEVVRRREIPYWQQRGWIRDGSVYRGNYQTRYGAFAGLVEERYGVTLNFYMFDPPPEVRVSGHWACFQPRKNNWFLVHMARRPDDVGSGIMTIERLITESFEQHS